MSNDALHTTGLTRRAFIGGALATGAALAMAGTNTQLAMADEPQAGGVLNYYITNPVAIEPFGAEENQGVEVMFNTFDPLCVFDWDKGEVVGLTAESWDVNDAADEFTFHIRPEAKFHNGQPVTSKDFKYAWERLVNANFKPQPSSLGYKLAQVQGADEMMNGTGTELAVECPDDLTFVVHLKAPFADFASIACERALAPVPAGCTDTEEDFQKFRVAPIGNGPFMMDGEWADGQYINLKPFADYWGEKPLLDGINFQILSSDDTAWLEYQAGNLDFLMVAAGHFNEARQMYGDAEDDGYLANPGHQYIWGDETSIYYLICNNEDEVMSNRDLRIAISCAINRQAICDIVFQGSRVPADNILMPGLATYESGVWGYCPAEGDPALANEYFDKAGYPANADGQRDLTITLSCNPGSSNETIMQMVQADLANYGVTANIDVQEWAAYLDACQSGDYQIGRMGWVLATPNTYTVLNDLFYTGLANNYSGYSNPEFDALIDEARQIPDEEERNLAYKEANGVVGEDFPVIPLMYYAHYYVASNRVHNLFLTPGSLTRLWRCWIG